MLSSDLVRSVLDSLPDALIIIDASGKIRFANHQVFEMFGLSPAEVIGAPVEILLPERFRGRHVHHRDGYSRSVRERPMGAGLELFGRRQDGAEFPVEISLSPLKQSDEPMVAAAIRDVTGRKLVEQALKDARQDAEHANIAKSRFLATASHDLRQPLQTLGLLNGALRRTVQDEDCRDMVQQQELALDSMSRLLNALLDISKLESGAIKVEAVDFALADLFDEMRHTFTTLATGKGLNLDVPATKLRVHSDPALIGQVLRNLLANAIKYTRAGSVALTAEAQDGCVDIEIRDTGIGIAADQMPRIFEEFYQVGISPNSTRDGYGLGLSIVQRIARLLDFKLRVSSVPGRGSTFGFPLPMATTAAGAAVAPADAASTSAVALPDSHRILLVEDESGVRNAMRMLLKLEGYHVATAATAADAVDLLEAHETFDLVITDFHLNSGHTGSEVIDAARRTLGASVRIILMTGDTSSAVRDIAAHENLRITSKPINARKLLELMRQMLAD